MQVCMDGLYVCLCSEIHSDIFYCANCFLKINFFEVYFTHNKIHPFKCAIQWVWTNVCPHRNTTIKTQSTDVIPPIFSSQWQFDTKSKKL